MIALVRDGIRRRGMVGSAKAPEKGEFKLKNFNIKKTGKRPMAHHIEVGGACFRGNMEERAKTRAFKAPVFTIPA